MLARYKIPYMRPIPEGSPEAAPSSVRIDTRKHTKHCLRPSEEAVEAFQNGRIDWAEFTAQYIEMLEDRYAHDRGPFDALAERAMCESVFLGCSCPTKKNPDINHCHTVLALRFMREKYSELVVSLPQ